MSEREELKGTDLVERPEEKEQISLGQLMFDNPGAIVEQAQTVARTLTNIINKQKLYSTIRNQKFVKVEGWTTLGAMLGVIPRTVKTEEIGDGIFEATVELIRTSDGMVVGRGIAECGSPDETDRKGNPIWANRPRYARKSMAITRATGKAFRLSYSWIVQMAGFAPTPAEEMSEDFVDGEFREELDPQTVSQYRIGFKKAKSLFEGDEPTIAELFAKDPDYCGWIADNVDGDAGDAVRMFLNQARATQRQAKEQPRSGEGGDVLAAIERTRLILEQTKGNLNSTHFWENVKKMGIAQKDAKELAKGLGKDDDWRPALQDAYNMLVGAENEPAQ